MGVLEKVLVGGVATLIGTGIFKTVQEARKDAIRQKTKLEFDSSLSAADFSDLAERLALQTSRVTGAAVDRGIVTIHVRSNSGLTSWSAKIDFNNHGKLTGKYWISTENDQSPIPTVVAESIRSEIKDRIGTTLHLPDKHD